MSAADIDWDNITDEQKRWLETLILAWLRCTVNGGQILRQHDNNVELAIRSVYTLIACGLVEVKRDERGDFRLETPEGMSIHIDKVEKVEA